jgi:hypothetical protein
MGRPPIGKTAMTGAERVQRYRLKHAPVTKRKTRSIDDAPLKARIRKLEAQLAAATSQRHAAKPEPLSMSAKQRLDAAIAAGERAYRKKLEGELEGRVRSELQRLMTKLAYPALEQRERDAARIISARKGVFKLDDYDTILSCLYPHGKPSFAQKNKAFRLFHERQLLLLSAKDDDELRARVAARIAAGQK